MGSIYEWIKTEMENGTFRSDCRLPDHADLGYDGGNWVPGAYESLLMRSTYSIRRYAIQNYLLARKVRRQIMKPCEKNREASETALLKTGALAVVDPLISFLFYLKTDKAAMRTEALRLATGSEKRELVKVGIALLGMCASTGEPSDNPDLDVILTLSKHEEFTFYGAPAVRSIVGAAKVNDLLLPLTKELDGWGKTAVLYELNYDKALSGNGVNPASDYLLRRGCYNRLGPQVNANLCATKGDMYAVLEAMLSKVSAAENCEGAPEESEKSEEPVCDQELWQGICEIMWGLTAFDGVYDNINDYKNGIGARNDFKKLVETLSYLEEYDPRGAQIIERLR